VVDVAGDAVQGVAARVSEIFAVALCFLLRGVRR